MLKADDMLKNCGTTKSKGKMEKFYGPKYSVSGVRL
jgi:hypothetical protein